MCAICKHLHKVQVHHIVPREDGGTDDIENAIPLCPNCHDEVHATYTSGRTTRRYTAGELRRHLEETVNLAARQASLARGNADWQVDADLIAFYAQCLDRPAFRTYFHQELSFADLDRALEDTLLAINTGYWRTRDGAVLNRAVGKIRVTNPSWREKLDGIAAEIEAARGRLRGALALDRELMHQADHRHWLDRSGCGPNPHSQLPWPPAAAAWR
jgi:hypothetical protein